ncbi:MAG: O-antigen ligase family protein [Myxococcales bacterium]|nr:O-antigen ligase family protein [Myxococcales bacterium]
MFSIFGICGLLFFILARPQEYFVVLQKLPMLYLFVGAAAGGYLLDVKLRLLELRATPILKLVAVFLLWTTLSNVLMAGPQLTHNSIELAILFVLFATIAHGVQRLRTLRVVAATLMLTCLGLSAVGVHQGLQDRTCIILDEEHGGEGTPDGRPCELAEDCFGDDAEPGSEYRCEKGGLFDTFSIEDRVRYRGELQDPNELGLTICIGGFSLLIAFANQRRRLGTIAIAILGSGLVFWCVLATQSRGGIVVFALIGAVYFARRFGVAGLIAGAAMAAPVLAVAGRSGDKADQSTQLRYEAWSAGLQMWKQSPVFGVGQRQFVEHHFMTAHNSYVLSLAELGIVGMVLFISMLVLTVKTLVLGIRQLEHVPGARPAQAWALALLASFVGMMFSINTLSFCWHSVLWIFLGLGGAWVSVVRTHKPDFEVKLTFRDFAFITVACVSYALVILPIYLRSKGE